MQINLVTQMQAHVIIPSSLTLNTPFLFFPRNKPLLATTKNFSNFNLSNGSSRTTFTRKATIKNGSEVSNQEKKEESQNQQLKRAYPFHEIEPNWQSYWEENDTFKTPDEIDTSKPKYYILDMFPYPSGAGLHVGHPLGYTATDILARYKRMQGFNILHPMGWDAFGLPAEQYAIETGTHPKTTTLKNIGRFRAQAEVPVNWCPALGTVLANEEVVDGVSERGGHPVIKKPMRQWMLKITAYADRLLEDLNDLDWPESIKEMQRNWIGRSEGAEMGFCVEEYIELASRKSDLERTELQKEKTGVFTGSYARNPVNREAIPIWVADYVLGSYGTGAIMAVPAHDSRDHDFAMKYDIPICWVVNPEGESNRKFGETYSGEGIIMNSSGLASKLDINGLHSKEAASTVINWAESTGHGKRKVNYKLRDWLFARQRYWGEPFPVVFLDDTDEIVPVPESELPVILPELDDFTPTGTGEPPLAKAVSWVKTTDPTSGKPARRETITMPQWAGSCW
ncbi:hypothetical protein C5167_009448 [Papaver somniferum]|uniref:leucine--tRNA ligase n=1 Tax=Papaver somniferum TaxID=3469 RepID=A0A4Y7JXF9_PAPSO|nr:hypothetical protein C5167_009448 [Papaver somniferum]